MERRNDKKRKRDQITTEPDIDETRKVSVKPQDEEEEKVPKSPVNKKMKKLNAPTSNDGVD